MRVPVLIVNGDIDFQVTPDNADALAKAQPRSRKTIIEGMTHTLKKASGPTRTEQIAAYTDDTLPVAPELVAAVTGFIKDSEVRFSSLLRRGFRHSIIWLFCSAKRK